MYELHVLKKAKKWKPKQPSQKERYEKLLTDVLVASKCQQVKKM